MSDEGPGPEGSLATNSYLANYSRKYTCLVPVVWPQEKLNWRHPSDGTPEEGVALAPPRARD